MVRTADVTPPRVRTTAAVAGASMAGLFAARVLADRFDNMVVIDRGKLPATPEWRTQLPQARHVHLLLGDDAQPLEQRFPAINRGTPCWCCRRMSTAAPTEPGSPAKWSSTRQADRPNRSAGSQRKGSSPRRCLGFEIDTRYVSQVFEPGELSERYHGSLLACPRAASGQCPTSICAQIGDASTARWRVHFRVICHATAWRLPDV